jgi:hypothetical protein
MLFILNYPPSRSGTSFAAQASVISSLWQLEHPNLILSPGGLGNSRKLPDAYFNRWRIVRGWSVPCTRCTNEDFILFPSEFCYERTWVRSCSLQGFSGLITWTGRLGGGQGKDVGISVVGWRVP